MKNKDEQLRDIFISRRMLLKKGKRHLTFFTLTLIIGFICSFVLIGEMLFFPSEVMEPDSSLLSIVFYVTLQICMAVMHCHNLKWYIKLIKDYRYLKRTYEEDYADYLKTHPPIPPEPVSFSYSKFLIHFVGVNLGCIVFEVSQW